LFFPWIAHTIAPQKISPEIPSHFASPLQDRLGISDMPMMPMGGAMPAGGGAAPAEEVGFVFRVF